MRADLFVGLAAFGIVMSVTPGPNNMMLLASGVNHGFRRTLPHMLGISLGFSVMVFLVGIGLGRAFIAVPAAYEALKYAGAVYLLWLAWKIANAGEVKEGKSAGRPMSFTAAALFQWVNPKAWVMAVSAITTYQLFENPYLSAAAVAIIFGVFNFPAIALWAAFGTAMRGYLADPHWLRAFNWTMAVLLVLSLVPVFWTG